ICKAILEPILVIGVAMGLGEGSSAQIVSDAFRCFPTQIIVGKDPGADSVVIGGDIPAFIQGEIGRINGGAVVTHGIVPNLGHPAIIVIGVGDFLALGINDGGEVVLLVVCELGFLSARQSFPNNASKQIVL